jgi:hypothetical protein
MAARWALALMLLALLHPTRVLGARPVSFNLSTDRSFAPTEKPTIHLYAQNVDELEFRIYRVRNPAKFLAGLPDLHSFDNGTPWGPKEQIDANMAGEVSRLEASSLVPDPPIFPRPVHGGKSRPVARASSRFGAPQPHCRGG